MVLSTSLQACSFNSKLQRQNLCSYLLISEVPPTGNHQSYKHVAHTMEYCDVFYACISALQNYKKAYSFFWVLWYKNIVRCWMLKTFHPIWSVPITQCKLHFLTCQLKGKKWLVVWNSTIKMYPCTCFHQEKKTLCIHLL